MQKYRYEVTDSEKKLNAAAARGGRLVSTYVWGTYNVLYVVEFEVGTPQDAVYTPQDSV